LANGVLRWLGIVADSGPMRYDEATLPFSPKKIIFKKYNDDEDCKPYFFKD